MGRTLVLAALASIALLVTFPVAALAHADLVSTSPAAGERVPATPKQLTLTFSEGVSGAERGVSLVGNDVGAQAPLAITQEAGNTVIRITPPTLRDDVYQLSWRLLSDDGHVVQGSLRFGVGVPPPSTDSLEATSTDGQERSPTILLDRYSQFLSFATYVGLALLVGAALMALLSRGSVRLRAQAVVGGVITAGAGVLTVPVTAGLVVGNGYLGLVDTDAWLAVSGAGLGRAALARAVLSVAATGALLLTMRRATASPRGMWALTDVLLSATIVTVSASGHAATSARPALSITMLSIHLAAASIWLGGLVGLATLLIQRRRTELASVLPNFAVVALASVLALSATGVISAAGRLSSPQDVLTSTYGRLLTLKTLLLLLLVAVAFVSRRAVRHGFAQTAYAADATLLSDPDVVGETPARGNVAFATLRRTVPLELLLGTLALIAAGLLVSTPPPSAVDTAGPAAAATESVEKRFSDPVEGLVTLTAVAGTGTVGIGVQLTGPDARPAEAVAVASVQGADPLDDPVPLPLRERSVGEFISTDVAVGRGPATITLSLTRPSGQRETHELKVVVR